MSHAFTRYQPSGNGRDFFIVRDADATRGKREVGFYDVNPPHVERFYKEERKIREETGDTVPFAREQAAQGQPQRTTNYMPGYSGHAPKKCDTVGLGYSQAKREEDEEAGTGGGERSSFKPNQSSFEQLKRVSAGKGTGLDHTAKTMNTLLFSNVPTVPKSGALSLQPGPADLAPGFGGHKGRNLPESVLQTIKRERTLSGTGPSTSGEVSTIKRSETGQPKEIEAILKKVRASLAARGADGIVGLSKSFRIMDEDGSGALSHREFRTALQEYGLVLSPREYELLAEHFDSNHDGQIDLDEFLIGLRGTLNEKRRAAVQRAFSKLDTDDSGVVDMTDIRSLYNAEGNPKVITGEMTEEQVLQGFLSNFDILQHDGVVYYEEFEKYYANMSANFDNDDHFVLMVENAWKGAAKKPQARQQPAQQRAALSRERMDVKQVLDSIRNKLKERGTVGIAKLGKNFRIIDDDGSRKLSPEEFQEALNDFDVRLYPEEVDAVIQQFDSNGDGSIDYDEFLYGLRGELNETRLSAIRDAFVRLDANQNGKVELDDVYAAYNCTGHPEVQSGKKTEDQVMREFLDTFDGGVKDGVVHPEEFARYYADISASIDSDEYFVTMMENAWRKRGARRPGVRMDV